MIVYRVYLEVRKLNDDGCVAARNSQHTLSRVVSLLRAITLIVPHYEPLVEVLGLRLSEKVSLALCKTLPLRHLILRCLVPARSPLQKLRTHYTQQPMKPCVR